MFSISCHPLQWKVCLDMNMSNAIDLTFHIHVTVCLLGSKVSGDDNTILSPTFLTYVAVCQVGGKVSGDDSTILSSTFILM